MKYFRLEEFDGIDYWIFDTPNSSANIFNEESLKELDALASKQDPKKPTVIMSAKKSIFIAGADINLIKRLKTVDEAKLAGKAGQQIFEKISKLNAIAAIHGACMGGGCELALACRFRVCSDSPKTKIALPEVQLGVLPGWGGTQRLPRQIGLIRSLDYILTGKAFDANKARSLKLVDAVLPAEVFEAHLHKFALKVKNGRAKPKKAVLTPVEKLLESSSLTRMIPFSKAKSSVMSKTKGAYPAPLKILEVLQKTFNHGPVTNEGLALEAQGFGELAATDISKYLIDIFQGSEAKKKTPAKNAGNIHMGAVLGAGIMGGGIAWAFSEAGIPCYMKDISDKALEAGKKSALKVFEGKWKRRKKFGNELNLAIQKDMKKINPTLTYDGFQKVDVVIEAVVEDLKIKRKVMEETAGACNPKTVLATNTSSILVSDIQKDLSCKDRIVGMHFFNPVNMMPLVEVIAGKDTNAEAVDTIVALTQKMGKVPIVVNDGPGFLVNRLLVPYMNEAAFLLEEGVTVECIDRALLNFGMPMGPLHLLDEVGIDVGAKVSKILQGYFGDRMPACKLSEKIVEKGLLGKKAGKGIYIYKGKEKSVNPEVTSLISNKKVMSEDEIIQRTVWPMIAEAERAMEDGIFMDPFDCDLAMIFGTGFPPFRGGLLKYADKVGISLIQGKLDEFSKKFGKRYEWKFKRTAFYSTGNLSNSTKQTVKLKEIQT